MGSTRRQKKSETKTKAKDHREKDKEPQHMREEQTKEDKEGIEQEGDSVEVGITCVWGT